MVSQRRAADSRRPGSARSCPSPRADPAPPAGRGRAASHGLGPPGPTNPLERVNLEIARRSDVVGIYPNDAALLRLATSLLVEQNDEWLIQKRYLSLHSLAALTGADAGPSGPPRPARQR